MLTLVAASLTFLTCAAKVPADTVCALEAGSAGVTGREFASGQPLTLRVAFGFSGCVSPDATCAVAVDGGVISLETSATVCSTGCNPGGVMPSTTCNVPGLAAGAYRLAPFNQTLIVVADGGVTGC